MIVRYGLPIIASSILGKQSSNLVMGSTSSAATVLMLNKGYYYYSWEWTTHPHGLTLSNHKYFLYIKFNTNLNIKFQVGIGRQGSTIVNTDYWNNYNTNTEFYCVYDNSSQTITDLNTIYLYCNTSASERFDSSTNKPLYYLLIDLTEIGLDGLTADEFYNKYKNKLSELSEGNETILFSGKGNPIIGTLYSQSTIKCKIN